MGRIPAKNSLQVDEMWSYWPILSLHTIFVRFLLQWIWIASEMSFGTNSSYINISSDLRMKMQTENCPINPLPIILHFFWRFQCAAVHGFHVADPFRNCLHFVHFRCIHFASDPFCMPSLFFRCSSLFFSHSLMLLLDFVFLFLSNLFFLHFFLENCVKNRKIIWVAYPVRRIETKSPSSTVSGSRCLARSRSNWSSLNANK